MTPQILDSASRCIDYRLNILGIRVGDNYCQLIAKCYGAWTPFGPRRSLPVKIPATPAELQDAASDVLRMTAYQYQAERPKSDLAAVLSQTRSFEAAFNSLSETAGGGGEIACQAKIKIPPASQGGDAGGIFLR